MRKEGVVESKEEFWLQWDIQDLETAGSFVPREIWDNFILKKNSDKIIITPTDYTRKRR